MKPDVIAPPIIPAAPAAAIAPTDAEPPAGQCVLCGQPMDPQAMTATLDGMLTDEDPPVCWDCRVETTTRRREPGC